jgi:4-oxalocrotonate tautomerase
MPIVTVQMLRGRSADQKRSLVRAITDAMVTHTGAKPDNLIVVIEEVERDNWATNGQLLSDRDTGPAR